MQLKGGRVLYASADGQFVMQGYLYQVKDGKPVNLTEKAEKPGDRQGDQRRARQRDGGVSGQAKAHITVFTDTTCPTARSCMPRCRT